MRGIGAILIIAVGGLVVVGVWNARQWLPQRYQPAAGSIPVAASKSDTAKAETPKAPAHSKRPPAKADQGPANTSADMLTPKADSSNLNTNALASMQSFPTRKDLPAGETGVQVRARFGEPTARVIKTNEGRVFEEYYYFNRDRTALTVATLKSGVIVSTQSTLPLNNNVTGTVIP